MATTKKKKRSGNPLLAILLILVMIAVILAAQHFTIGSQEVSSTPKTDEITPEAPVLPGQEAAGTSETTPAESTPAETQAAPVTLTVSCVGDCTLGTDENFDQSTSLPAYAESEGLDYFFAKVSDIFQADDLTIVNMEGTLTDSTERADKQFAFKGDPSYGEILTSGGVEACNLANNHSRDYGARSYINTQANLQAVGLISFGYKEDEKVAITEVKGVRVALIGIYVLAKDMDAQEDLEDAMSVAKANDAELIIVSFHWGEEKATVPNSTQVALGHKAVDLGANLVIGHHPHVLQGIEEYNGVNIVYSLGNFCFGGNKNPSDKDTMIFQQTFTVTGGQVAKDNVSNIIPCSLSGHSDYNDYQPTPATGDEADRILAKIQERSDAI